ncbi:unnamed protein product, partial [Prorocentrum cordatum]
QRAAGGDAPGAELGGSCAYYGCSETFRVMWACQCSPGCELQDNCCSDYATTCRAPARALLDDGSAAMALRMDDRAPWKQEGERDGTPAAPQPDAAGGLAAPREATGSLQHDAQQAAPQRSTQLVQLPSQPLTPARPALPPAPSPPPPPPPAEQAPQEPPRQAPQEPEPVERQTQQTTEDLRPRPEPASQLDPPPPKKKPSAWILPLAGAFAAAGTLLLAIAGARQCCRGTAAPRGRPGAVAPLRSPRDNSPLMVSPSRQDPYEEDDIVNSFESQVKEAKQRAKSLTRKSHSPPARPSSR